MASGSAKGFIANHLNRAVVGLQGVVEGQLVLGQTEPSPGALASRISLASSISSSITCAASIARFWQRRRVRSSSSISAKERACTTFLRCRVDISPFKSFCSSSSRYAFPAPGVVGHSVVAPWVRI